MKKDILNVFTIIFKRYANRGLAWEVCELMDKELLVNSLRSALSFDDMPEITDSMILEMTEGTFLRKKIELAIFWDCFWDSIKSACKI